MALRIARTRKAHFVCLVFDVIAGVLNPPACDSLACALLSVLGVQSPRRLLFTLVFSSLPNKAPTVAGLSRGEEAN